MLLLHAPLEAAFREFEGMMDLVVALMRRARSYMNLASRANDDVRHSEMLELAACCLDAAAQGLRRIKQDTAPPGSVG